MKNRIPFFVLSFLLFFQIPLFSAGVSTEKAETVARNFYLAQFGSRAGLSPDQLAVAQLFTHAEQGEVMYFVFNMSPAGFVMISGWDGTLPVLAAGAKGAFDPDDQNQPPAFREMMNGYLDQIREAVHSREQADQEVAAAWQKWLQPPAAQDPVRSVSPLVTTNWDQSCYYNAQCPYDNNAPAGYCSHVPVGCVAVSMAQVMKYYDYPATGTGSHSYYAYPYGMQSADFGNTTYNWDAMPGQVYSSNTAVATLLYHCGVSVDMQYGPDGSGAYTSDARTALVNYFNYSTDAAYVSRYSYSTSAWEQMLRDELDQGRPVIYRGHGTGGHAWVCDGYTGTNYFHMNWGWSGYYDGYYYLSDLTPGSANFNSDQAMIKGIYPEMILTQQTVILNAGWNAVSTDLVPADSDLSTILSGISDQLIIMQNLTGVYYPQMNLNTIGDWEQGSGYMIKVSGNCSFTLPGYQSTEKTVLLSNGWNLMPVLSDCPANTADLFAPIQDYIRIVKEADGTGVYWPAMGINSLPQLVPGKAYYVKIFTSKSVTFPNCDVRSE